MTWWLASRNFQLCVTHVIHRLKLNVDVSSNNVVYKFVSSQFRARGHVTLMSHSSISPGEISLRIISRLAVTLMISTNHFYFRCACVQLNRPVSVSIYPEVIRTSIRVNSRSSCRRFYIGRVVTRKASKTKVNLNKLWSGHNILKE